MILGSLTAFGPMSLDLYLPAFPQIAESLGVDIGAVQLTFSASLLGLSLGQLNYGPLADRYGRKRPLLAGLVLFTVASIACAFAPSLQLLVLFRFVQALGGCAGIVIARAIVRDLFSGADLAAALSAVATVSVLAPTLAPTVGALVLSVASWPWVFVALAAFGGYCFVAVLTLPESLPPERRTDHGFVDAMRAYAEIARTRVFRVAATLMGSSSMMLFSYVSSAPAVFIDGFGVSPQVFAVIFGVNSAFLAIGAQINIRLVHRLPAQRLLPGLLLVQTTGAFGVLTAALLGLPIGFTLVPLAVVMMCFSGTQSNAVAEILRPFPRNAGSAAALGGVTGMGMSAIMTVILSTLHTNARLEMGFGMAASALLGLTLAVLLSRTIAAQSTSAHAR